MDGAVYPATYCILTASICGCWIPAQWCNLIVCRFCSNNSFLPRPFNFVIKFCSDLVATCSSIFWWFNRMHSIRFYWCQSFWFYCDSQGLTVYLSALLCPGVSSGASIGVHEALLPLPDSMGRISRSGSCSWIKRKGIKPCIAMFKRVQENVQEIDTAFVSIFNLQPAGGALVVFWCWQSIIL